MIQRNEAAIREALEGAACSPKSVVQVLDHAAKLNKEIGSGADGNGGRRKTISFHRAKRIVVGIRFLAGTTAAHAAACTAPRRRR